MERSFTEEVELLKLGEGATFHGEGILAVTKALLQSGVSYVGGYQGAPVSHMMDVLNDARDIMDDLGIHIETNASEAGAAAMLGASINYPIRGAVTWKSTVGTNVASDALSNLASAGVKGGADDLQLTPAPVVGVEGCTAAAAGVDFSLWLAGGAVWSAGHPQHGVLGHGTDHE